MIVRRKLFLFYFILCLSNEITGVVLKTDDLSKLTSERFLEKMNPK